MGDARGTQKAANSIRVDIYDQGYNLRGTDADYIVKLAEYVDLKMRAVAGSAEGAHLRPAISRISETSQ